MPPDTPRRSLHALPPGTVLHDYVIDSELGSGGFSIVYLARHRLNSDWLVAIKEYLPRELAVRDNDGAGVHPVDTEAKDAFEDGLRRFRDEAEQLRKFRNEPYIVSCLNYFEGNGTAYLVMDYDDGLPLSEFLERREAAGQPFTEKDLLAVVEPLLEGLTVVHRADVLHRDIKPGNIFVRRQDDITGRPAYPVLIDFGAAKQNYLARHSRSRAPYTPGYAAFEQVSSMGEIGPWTDLYSLGAVMWRMVAGGCPDDSRLFVPNELAGSENDSLVWSPMPRQVEKRAYALKRGWVDPMPVAVDLGSGRFSSHMLKSIDHCLALYPEDRAQSCGEVRSKFDKTVVFTVSPHAGSDANRLENPVLSGVNSGGTRVSNAFPALRAGATRGITVFATIVLVLILAVAGAAITGQRLGIMELLVGSVISLAASAFTFVIASALYWLLDKLSFFRTRKGWITWLVVPGTMVALWLLSWMGSNNVEIEAGVAIMLAIAASVVGVVCLATIFLSIGMLWRGLKRLSVFAVNKF